MSRVIDMTGGGGVSVRGGATPEEIGAVLAVLSRSVAFDAEPTGYELWRRNRLRVIHTTLTQPGLRTSH